MKTIFTYILLFAIGFSTYSQSIEHQMPPKQNRKYKFCEPFLPLIDSVHTYTWNDNYSGWSENQAWIYSHNEKGFYTNYLLLNFWSRDSIARSKFYYNSEDQVELWEYDQYSSGNWNYSVKRESFYSLDGSLYQDYYYRWTDNEWEIYQILTYKYENDRLDNYLITWFDELGAPYDFAYNYHVYNVMGQLIERYEQRISDDVIQWHRIQSYNDEGLMEERIHQVLGVDPTTNDIGLVNYRRELFEYNRYNILEIVYRDTWKDQNWKKQEKRAYFSNVNNKTKVKICHNGNSICISINALHSHLKHGDYLGDCQEVTKKSIKKKSDYIPEESIEESDLNINVFPNPTSSNFTISVSSEYLPIQRIEIINVNGTVAYSEEYFDQTIIYMNSKILPGIYIIKIIDSDSKVYQKKLVVH